ncbi:NnrU family protein [Sulfitobacter sp.]|uniref:NnrU family protein n=1 Tax=Sulfitobacter sp. TaxID=1903071 RepID=UPI003EF711B7
MSIFVQDTVFIKIIHTQQFKPSLLFKLPPILLRAPLLATLTLSAGLHLLPNRDLAHVIMFSTFLGFAILGRKVIDLRTQSLMGSSEWHAHINEIKTGNILFSPDL